MLMPDAGSGAIAQAAKDILGDDRFRAGAKRMAVAMGDYGGAVAAAAALERATSGAARPAPPRVMA
jgi:UDP:flavonoid glycosyltransferase YjiC (YdhE family)